MPDKRPDYIRARDTVRIVSGPYKGREGPVLAVGVREGESSIYVHVGEARGVRVNESECEKV